MANVVRKDTVGEISGDAIDRETLLFSFIRNATEERSFSFSRHQEFLEIFEIDEDDLNRLSETVKNSFEILTDQPLEFSGKVHYSGRAVSKFDDYDTMVAAAGKVSSPKVIELAWTSFDIPSSTKPVAGKIEFSFCRYSYWDLIDDEKKKASDRPSIKLSISGSNEKWVRSCGEEYPVVLATTFRSRLARASNLFLNGIVSWLLAAVLALSFWFIANNVFDLISYLPESPGNKEALYQHVLDESNLERKIDLISAEVFDQNNSDGGPIDGLLGAGFFVGVLVAGLITFSVSKFMIMLLALRSQIFLGPTGIAQRKNADSSVWVAGSIVIPSIIGGVYLLIGIFF